MDIMHVPFPFWCAWLSLTLRTKLVATRQAQTIRRIRNRMPRLRAQALLLLPTASRFFNGQPLVTPEHDVDAARAARLARAAARAERRAGLARGRRADGGRVHRAPKQRRSRTALWSKGRSADPRWPTRACLDSGTSLLSLANTRSMTICAGRVLAPRGEWNRISWIDDFAHCDRSLLGCAFQMC